MNIKIKCEVCGKEILHPRTNQATCSPECSKQYQKTDKYKQYQKQYRESLFELARRHKTEFLEIFDKKREKQEEDKK